MPDKEYSRAEVAGLNGVHFIIDNQVYNVTAFLDEHPGGHEVLQAMHGKDASEDFHDVGHSIDAREMMKKWNIGVIKASEHKAVRPRNLPPPPPESAPSPPGLASWHLPVLLGLIVTLIYYYFVV